jgi:cellulose synthase/poly-beta-1,6-N-acetylglucosamine synthase-like glycosyltransferase
VKVSVVIPVYNERRYIERILLRVQAVAVDKEAIVVDDRSTDGTRGFLRKIVDAQTQDLSSITSPRVETALAILARSGAELDIMHDSRTVPRKP